LGEFYLSLYLETQLSRATAAAAAAGWDGDCYAVYYNEGAGELAMMLRTVWDDADEAGEFYETFRDFGESWAGRAPALDETNRVCWSAVDTLCASWNGGTETLVARAPTLDLAEGLLAQEAAVAP